MIKLLDKSTIDKIAAGEVIERPSSVVKELLENSIDAGATSVTVEIKDGGMSLIRVTDNGCGIPKDEVRLAYTPHATSKISSQEDLNDIKSLGFRGEALSTIAAVSQTEMITKTSLEMTGVKYTVHGSEEIELVDVGVPAGTTIVVRNLFYNTPARKKFLKSPMTEGSYINDLILRLALSHPDIAFNFISGGQGRLSTSGNGNIRDTIYQLFGKDITAGLIPVEYRTGDIYIHGFIGKPFICRGNRGLENYFINDRYIKSNVINRAIEEGYKTFVMQHKFPFTVLYIDLDRTRIDVNVHPTKMEFKYDDEKGLFEAVTRCVREGLLNKELIIKQSFGTENSQPKEKNVIRSAEKETVTKPAEPFEQKRAEQKQDMIPKPNKRYSESYNILERLKKAESEAALSPSGNDAYNLVLKDEGASYTPSAKAPENDSESKSFEKTNVQTSMFDEDFLTPAAKENHRLIGQLFETYWLIEYKNSLFIMDQHAAHEKVRYEALLRDFEKKEVFSQQLMPPMVVTVSYAERNAILEHFDLFMKIGYDLEEFGGNEFKINAVPSNLYGIHGRDMFMDFVSSLINNSGYISNDIFVKKLSTMACKSAIKGNTKISFSEADALITELLKLENPYTCPHGRPTIISMEKNELEKKFKRIV